MKSTKISTPFELSNYIIMQININDWNFEVIKTNNQVFEIFHVFSRNLEKIKPHS